MEKYEVDAELSEIKALLFFMDESFDFLDKLNRNYERMEKNSSSCLASETSRQIKPLIALSSTIAEKNDALTAMVNEMSDAS